jgi:transposase
VALVDALGNLADFLLLPGQRHDSVGADPLLEGLEIGALIADKGFDNDALRQELDARGATAVIPPKANRARQIACDFASNYPGPCANRVSLIPWCHGPQRS